MDNYIGRIEAEWVDRAVELPPDQRVYRVRLASGMECHAGYTTEYGWDGACVVAWLRIGGPSDAIPRAKVQAAVDEITKYADEIPGTRCARGLRWARRLIANHTGVTPAEVTPMKRSDFINLNPSRVKKSEIVHYWEKENGQVGVETTEAEGLYNFAGTIEEFEALLFDEEVPHEQ